MIGIHYGNGKNIPRPRSIEKKKIKWSRAKHTKRQEWWGAKKSKKNCWGKQMNGRLGDTEKQKKSNGLIIYVHMRMCVKWKIQLPVVWFIFHAIHWNFFTLNLIEFWLNSILFIFHVIHLNDLTLVLIWIQHNPILPLLHWGWFTFGMT